jgi:HEAT repeat protein
MALPMRLHLEAFLEAGYRGEGAPPARVGRCSKRAPENHGWTYGEIFANFGTARRTEYDPREQIDRMLSNPEIRSYTDPKQNAGACVLKTVKGGKVVVYLAVARVETRHVREEFDRAAHLASWILGGTDAERDEALRRQWAEAVHEGVPFYRSLLHDKAPARRVAAVNALGAVADPALLPVLFEILNDRDESVRKRTLEVLHSLSGKADLDADAQAWATWWKAAEEKFKTVGTFLPPKPAETAVPPEGEGETPPPPPDDPLAPSEKTADRMARKVSAVADPRARMFLVRAVGNARDAKAAGRLVPLVTAGPFPVAEEAANALARCSSRSLVGKIASVAQKSQGEPLLLLPLVKALGRTRDRKTVKVLASCALGNPNPAVAVACARALGGVRERSAVSALIRILVEAEVAGRSPLLSVARSSLASLTRASPGRTGADWKAWWAKNRSSFKFPH